MSVTNILIVEDQKLMREGLKTILELESDFHVIGVASNGEEGYQLAKETQPDLVIMDIRMPVMDGIQSTKLIKELNSEIKVIVLTTFEDDEYVIEALLHGATGYLLKDSGSEQLVQSIRNHLNGQMFFPASVAGKLVARIDEMGRGSALHKWEKFKETFTKREQQVMELIAKGMSNHEISNQLGISVGTVNNYISLIYDKLEIYDRGKLIVFLKELGL